MQESLLQEILFFVDADGIFTHNTIREMLNAFTSEKIGAVCGNDAPINLDRIQTHLACIQTHVGTGFVRRALAVINCLPIVSGNIGAFRRSVIEKTGPFLEGFIGEDLELTWRIHKAGYQVNFAPWAVVR
jgi:cellulose synthase/poly-beta-1,6-N-acetylglucosamine synthase-like glycosyltransferase